MHKELTLAAALAALGSGCAAGKALSADLAPAPYQTQTHSPAPLVEDHFLGDRSARITEENLRAVLAAPVFLERDARIGVVHVTGPYELLNAPPLERTLGALTKTLDGSGCFSVVTEVSTDWPADRGLAGLRELAARYRSEYLLLYRQRFVERTYTNAWGAAYATVIGAFFVPARTLESAGVLEATVLDVKSGTLLFTVFERTNGQSDENIWQNDRKLRALEERLAAEATKRLTDQVLAQVQKIYAAGLTQTEQHAAAAE